MGNLYFSVYVDEGTGYVVGRAMKLKSDQYESTLSAITEVKAVLGRFPSHFRSDNAMEFVSKQLKSALVHRDIFQENSAPYHAAGNGVAERMIGRLKAMVRVLLRQARLPSSWWQEALELAIYLHNRTVSSSGPSPLELITGTSPDLSKLRVFGCDAYVLQPKAAIFLGFDRNSMGTYKCWDPVARRMLTSRDVYFDERAFVGSPPAPPPAPPLATPPIPFPSSIAFLTPSATPPSAPFAIPPHMG